MTVRPPQVADDGPEAADGGLAGQSFADSGYSPHSHDQGLSRVTVQGSRQTNPRRNGSKSPPSQTGLSIDHQARDAGASATAANDNFVTVELGLFAEVLAEMLASGYSTHDSVRADAGVLTFSQI